MTKYESNIDVPVLLIFFNRPFVFSKVFEKVREARPSTLFLYQDGKREGNQFDEENIAKCREIASNIDWNCKVYTKYQDINYGCDPSEYIAQKWAFSIVDKCIILEDDDVPDVSFFEFCKQMLDKYENDTRICRISGMNHLGISENRHESYFFTTSGAIWGWASWRRVIDQWDSKYSFLDSKTDLALLKDYCKSIHVNYRQVLKTCRMHKSMRKEYYESIFYSNRLFSSGLTIVPKKNLISNFGLTSDSTHATSNIQRLPKGIHRVFEMKTYPMEFPMVHPKYVINDLHYVKEVNKIMGYGFCRRCYRRFESIIRRIVFKEK